MSQLTECLNCVKQCSACGHSLSHDSFYGEKSGKQIGRLSSRCKPCMKKSSAEWAKNNRERKREIGRESSYRTKYGLEPDQVELMKSGGCQLCGSTTGLAIDHCHVAGKVRGALCITCNTALERVEREGWIDAAKEYLWRNS